MCASLRGAPECSKHRIPAATPHAGQGTDANCFAVSSFILICPSVCPIPPQVCPLWHIAPLTQQHPITLRFQGLCVPVSPLAFKLQLSTFNHPPPKSFTMLNYQNAGGKMKRSSR